MNVYGQAVMGQSSLTPTPQSPMMQHPQASGGFRMPPSGMLAAPAPMAPQQPPQPSPVLHSSDAQDGAGPQVPGTPESGFMAGGPSAANLYADYLKNQQANLNSYLTQPR